MNFDAIMEAQQATAAGYTLLGRVFWASFSSNRLSHDTLLALADAAQVPTRYLPKEVSAKGAFGRAWRTMANRVGEGYILRHIGEDTDVVAVGLVRETRSIKDRDLDYDPLVVVTFDKKTHDLYFDEKRPGAPADLEHRLRAAYAYYRLHTTDAIRSVCSAFVRECGAALKPGKGAGGVYFVPERHATIMEAIVRFAESIPGASNVCGALPIPDSRGTRAMVAQSAATGLGEEIRQAEQALVDFDFSKNFRGATLENKLAEYESIRSRVEMFSGVLSLKASDLQDRLAALKANVSHILNGGDPDTAPKVAVKGGAISDAAAAAEAIEAFDEAAGF